MAVDFFSRGLSGWTVMKGGTPLLAGPQKNIPGRALGAGAAGGIWLELLGGDELSPPRQRSQRRAGRRILEVQCAPTAQFASGGRDHPCSCP